MLAESSPDATALGSWMQIAFYILGILCAVIVALVHVASYFRKERPAPDSELVTRGEITAVTARIEKDLRELKDTGFVTRVELGREVDRLDKEVKDLKTYMSSRTHDLANKLHAINIRIVWMMGVLTQLAGKTDGVSIPSEPMISTVDEA